MITTPHSPVRETPARETTRISVSDSDERKDYWQRIKERFCVDRTPSHSYQLISEFNENRSFQNKCCSTRNKYIIGGILVFMLCAASLYILRDAVCVEGYNAGPLVGWKCTRWSWNNTSS